MHASLNPLLYDKSKFLDQPSDPYKKYFGESHQFLGRSRARNVMYRSEEFVDDEFIAWIIENFPGENVPKYTLTRPTIEQGYEQASKFGVENTLVIDEKVKGLAMSVYNTLVATWLRTEWRPFEQVRKTMANDTACGIPFNSACRMKGEIDHKVPLWDVGYAQYYAEMASKEYPPSIFSSSVKLEYRPYSKVLNDEPRTFMPSPFFRNCCGCNIFLLWTNRSLNITSIFRLQWATLRCIRVLTVLLHI